MRKAYENPLKKRPGKKSLSEHLARQRLSWENARHKALEMTSAVAAVGVMEGWAQDNLWPRKGRLLADPELAKRVKALAAQGFAVNRIAKELGVSKRTIQSIGRHKDIEFEKDFRGRREKPFENRWADIISPIKDLSSK